MDINELKEKLLWQMTGEEFLYLHQQSESANENKPLAETTKRYVYGIRGIANLFGCSINNQN